MRTIADNNVIFGLRGIIQCIGANTATGTASGFDIEIVTHINIGGAERTLAEGAVPGIDAIAALAINVNVGAVAGNDKHRVIRRVHTVGTNTVDIFTVIGSHF